MRERRDHIHNLNISTSTKKFIQTVTISNPVQKLLEYSFMLLHTASMPIKAKMESSETAGLCAEKPTINQG